MFSQDFFLINEIIFILINAIGFWIALLIYLADRKAKANQYFLIGWGCLIVWMDLFFIALFSPFLISQEYAVLVSWLSIKSIILLTSLVLIFGYFFMLYFPIESKRNYVFDKIYVFIWIFLSFLAFTDLVIKSVEFEGYQFKLFGGELMSLYLSAAIISIFLMISIPIKKYFLLAPEEKSKVKYFIGGISFMGASCIIFIAVIPLLRGGNFTDNPIYFLIGTYSVFFANSLAAYAILNKKLFNIRVLLTQLLVVVMGILLLITPFLVNIPWLKTLLSMVFLLFCVFGWLLVRSSIREVKQKEILEQTVQERTKELQASKHELELNKIELEKKVAELEKWYKLTVGRELRMVELKQKIKTLEEDLKGKGGLKP